ncbi:MAG: hypothetical protein P4M12_02725 [Gammaproteobacteria bacterium]|nr:hypothetical protein [Gammaproteobacteria bacterium]
MNKRRLRDFIDTYNSQKGCRRKYFFCYPSASEDMQKLINYTNRLGEGGFLITSELKKLQSILENNLFRKKNEGSLTNKIFRNIYDELRADPVIRKMPNFRW